MAQKSWYYGVWSILLPKAWFPYRCICRICRVCRTKKNHRTVITLWKPPVQMLNTKETTDTTCCTRKNEFYLSYEFFSYDRHDRYDRYNHMETRLEVSYKKSTQKDRVLDLHSVELRILGINLEKTKVPLQFLVSFKFCQKRRLQNCNAD